MSELITVEDSFDYVNKAIEPLKQRIKELEALLHRVLKVEGLIGLEGIDLIRDIQKALEGKWKYTK